VICAAIILLSVSASYYRYAAFTGFQGVRVTNKLLLIHYSAKNFLTVRCVLRITALCIRIYRPGQNLSRFELSCSFFWGAGGMIPVVDGPNGTIRPRTDVMFSLALLLGLYILELLGYGIIIILNL
jgi:hypothetical protein